MSLSELFNTSIYPNTTVLTSTPSPTAKYRRNDIVTKSLDINLQTKANRNALKWGTINVGILSIVLFDLMHKCPFSFSPWFYVEYIVAAVLTLCVLYYFGKYFYFIFNFKPVCGTDEQRRLLQFPDGDSSFIVAKEVKSSKSMPTVPANVTAVSWHSLMNDSNRSVASPGWTYNRQSPQQQQPQQLHQHHKSFNQSYGQNVSWRSFQNTSSLNNTANISPNKSMTFSSPYQKCNKDEIITDNNGFQKYLKELSDQESSLWAMNLKLNNETIDRSSMNSIWNYCSNAANLLKTSLYQMAPTTTISPKQPSTATGSGSAIGKDEIITDIDGHSDQIKKLYSTGHLNQYIYNIRTWIACTILHRLVDEIDKTNKSFENRGFLDIQIGSISLYRLKKTAENQQLVTLYAPRLPMVVPFLDMSNNQEYLIRRIRDLATGCVLANYKWNSGGSYNGLGWDEHLPTDAAIVFHLFCVYLDTQLRPLPQPGGRPFYNRHVIVADKKTSKEILTEFTANNMKCAILFTNGTKPKFNFISNDKIHNCVQDRNNLFYVILEFLIYMKEHNDGLLQGVNLGQNGINLLSTIDH